jgi:Arc/MetJ family transcription regulator
MRTTVTLDDDVVAEVERLRRERSIGVSAALNELVRRGLAGRPEQRPFVQRTSDGGALVDVANTAETLDLLDGPARE